MRCYPIDCLSCHHAQPIFRWAPQVPGIFLPNGRVQYHHIHRAIEEQMSLFLWLIITVGTGMH